MQCYGVISGKRGAAALCCAVTMVGASVLAGSDDAMHAVGVDGKRLLIKSAVNALAICDDGTLLACADGCNAEVWELPTGKALLQVPHPDVVVALTLAPDKKSLLTLTAGVNDSVRHWSLPGGKLIGEYFRPASDDGEDEDHLVQRTRPCHAIPADGLNAGLGFTAVGFSSDGRAFATGDSGGTVRVWRLADKKPFASTRERAGPVCSVLFSPDGAQIAASYSNGTFVVWGTAGELKVIRRVHQIVREPGGGLRSIRVVFSSDSQRFAFWGPETRAVHICDVATGEEVRKLAFNGPYDECVGFLSGNSSLVLRRRNVLELHDANSGRIDGRVKMMSGVHPLYRDANLVYAKVINERSAIACVEVENDENTMHENWTFPSVVPLRDFTSVK